MTYDVSLAGGDYGGAWDLWTADAQRALPRADFVALGTGCPHGVPAVRTGDTFVDGAWRYQPDQSTLDGYRQDRC